MEGHSENKFLFYGLLVYLVLFYAQPAGRFPFLQPFRLELVLAVVLILGAAREIAAGRMRIDENRINLAIIGFFAFLVLSMPFALVKTRALDGFVRIAKLLPIYLMIVSCMRDERRLRIFIYVYLSLIALIFVQPVLTSHFVYNNHMMRLAGITGYFAHPNQLGMITSSHLAFYYYLMFYEKSKILKCTHFAMILIGIRAVMLTQSRTGMLGVIAFGGFVWIFGKRKVPMAIAMLLCLVVAWQFMPDKSKERFLSLTKIGKVLSTERSEFADDEKEMLGSMASRFELSRRSVIAFVENPVMGVGLNCFSSWSGQRWGNWWFPPHNTYLQAVAELGIIGTGAFFLIIYYTLQNLRRAERKLVSIGRENSFGCKIIRPVVLYYLIFLVVSFFGIEIYSNVWWVVGGLSLVILRNANHAEKEAGYEEVNPGAAAG